MKKSTLLYIVFILLLWGGNKDLEAYAKVVAKPTTTKKVSYKPSSKSPSKTTKTLPDVPFQDTLQKTLYAYLTEVQPFIRTNTPHSDSVKIDKSKKSITIYANKSIESVPFRDDVVRKAYELTLHSLPPQYKSYKIEIKVNGYGIGDLVPNFYREEKIDKGRLIKTNNDETPIVRRLNAPRTFTKGLDGNTLALWASHGWHFNTTENRWAWQRPRLFQIAEDTYTQGFMLPYIVPMLENAGAYVMMPRERDTQVNEVIVDNDDNNFFYNEGNDDNNHWVYGDTTGFGRSDNYLDGTFYYEDGENPFCYGSYRKIKCNKNGSCYASWSPNIPEDGDYAVYVSYHTLPNSSSDAHYTIYHSGGSTEFLVNQKMGGSTWIYLGTFPFKKGLNPEAGSVELSNKGKSHTTITADAVRFGGGNSIIAKRNNNDTLVLGNMPKYLEAARYWLQWAGFPDSVYSKTDFKDDYKDDYMCRGYWVNNLIGGSSKAPHEQGLHIPIQAAFGLHTDAGFLRTDSLVGTMSIYMSESNGNFNYTNGQRRIAGRDFSDIIQTQVVNDIRQSFRPNWTRRKLTDASYFEARIPEVPTSLLELLSHQNYTDMRYGLDPNFKFTVSRSIYKGILKYLCNAQGRDYVVQPLPIRRFHCFFVNDENNVVRLSWDATYDPLEPTAIANDFILYTAIDDNGWDNGILLDKSSADVSLEPGKVYRFKVTACNDGGESFPSEILCAGYVPGKKKALVINGFHRVAAPDSFETDLFSGFLDNVDPGVPDHSDLSYTGSQYVFNKYSKYRSNSHPGHGASRSYFEKNIIAGNTFDYTYTHGKAIIAAGCSFVSCSDEFFHDGVASIGTYHFVDLILGKEKTTLSGATKKYQIFPDELRKSLHRYLTLQRGNLYVSGAYVASDIFDRDSCDSDLIDFAERTLKYKISESHMTTRGLISNYFSPWNCFKTKYFRYINSLNEKTYAVETPDGLDTSNGSQIIHSFEGCNLPATIGYKGRYKTIVSSVPFESIDGEENRIQLMKEILTFFNK